MASGFTTGGALFLFLFLAGGINPGLKAIRPAWALVRGELMLVYGMMIVACALPTTGLVAYHLPIMVLSFYYATPENDWAQVIHPRRARFQHCVHGSPCVGGTCDDGDYFYAPGYSAGVVWSGLLPQYKIPDQSWHSWPIQEAIDFRKSDSTEGLQLFVQAPWGVIGDDKTHEVMAMVNSPVVVGGNREIPMYVGLTKSGEKYYLEPSLTRHISNQPERWEREVFSVDLDRGEAAVYTVDMAMFHGVSKEQILSLHTLMGDYLLQTEPSVEYGTDKAVVGIDIAVSGDAQLIIEDASSGKVLSTTYLVPGKLQQIEAKVPLPDMAADVLVILKNAAGRQVIAGGKRVG